jgi:peptidoglycan/xylan/chitin deacetylase (PgdA/CDA1 family)
VPELALTFDDGPDPRCTGKMLELLEAAGARATFFPIAGRAEAQPELVRRMLAGGHTVGLHCEEHVRHSERDREWCARDTDTALGRLRRVGANPLLWRTPWGDVAPWTGEVAERHGLRLIGWTVDTHDWRGDSPAEMLAATRPGLTPGAVVLAHDGLGPGALRQDTSATLAYVALVIEYARQSGLALEALA